MSQQPGFAGCIVFVEDYDTNIARHMVAGADVWLNNPRRPLEASGTSGEKASLNGVPNLSVLDGWWVEGYNGQNGWAIGEEREYSDEAAQDEADALSLYRLLEDEVVPLFYERDEQDIPRGWLAIMRAAIASVAPQFSLNRMLKDYVNQYYIPAGALGQKLAGENYAGARALSDWERRVKSAWPQVHLRASGPASGEIHVGQSIKVEATLQLGPLNPDDLSVELVYGQQQDGNLKTALVAPMLEDGNADGQLHYSVNLSSPDSGRFVYGVRVRPNQPDLPNPFALPMIRWA